MSENYEQDMVKAFVGKPNKPKKESWYLNVFAKMDANAKQNSTITWKWSWYSFFFGPFFLLYRKAYMATILYLVFTIVLGFIIAIIFIQSHINPQFAKVFNLLFAILIGGFGMHFVHKVYLKKKREIEGKFQDSKSRIEAMKISGGYHRWIIWLGFLFLLLPIIAAISVPKFSRDDAEKAYVKMAIDKVVFNVAEKNFQSWDTMYFTDIKGDPTHEISSATYIFRGDKCLAFITTPKGKITITKGEDLDKQNCKKLYDMNVIDEFPKVYDFSDIKEK